MKKTKKKNNGIWVILAIVAALVVVGLLGSGVLQKDPKPTPGPTDPEIDPDKDVTVMELGNGVKVTSVGSYAGMFVEDGSDEIVSGIAVATLENTGTDSIQVMNFSLQTEKGENYEFELTTLLPGQRMTVLEKNRKSYNAADKVVSAKVDHYGLFADAVSLHPETFMISLMDNKITIKNVSEQKISAGRLFYKNHQGDLFIGGITYMVSFSELAPGAEITLTPGHYSENYSRILFVTYAEQQ